MARVKSVPKRNHGSRLGAVTVRRSRYLHSGYVFGQQLYTATIPYRNSYRGRTRLVVSPSELLMVPGTPTRSYSPSHTVTERAPFEFMGGYQPFAHHVDVQYDLFLDD